jgi:peptide/nickel transport system substrate-binding protein
MLVALAVAACRGHAQRPSEAPVEIDVVSDAETLDPRYVTDAVGLRVSRLVHAGLTTLDPDSGAPLPYLARRITMSSDGMAVTFELRDDVRFHSGAPFRSHDVAATIAAFKDERVASRHARVLDAIGTVEEKDEHTVVVHLSRAHATTLTDLEIPILRADQAFAAADPNGTLDGLGPFTVSRRERGTIELSPAEHSPLPKPLHTIRVRTVRDENARALRLLAGDSDAIVAGVSPPLLPSLEGQGLQVASRASLSVTYVVLRVDRGPFSNEAARVGLGESIDRESIVRYLLAGRATIATGMLAPSHWAYARPDQMRPFDPARARAGLRGQQVHATLLCGTDRLRVDIARAIAQQAKDAGIEIEIVPLELGTLLARLGAGDFDAATLQLPELVEPNTLRVFLHSTSFPPNGSNRGRVDDPAVDALLDEGDRMTDRDSRRAVYASLEARIAERAWMLPLWHEDQIVALGPRALGFLPSAEGRWLSLAELRP